MNFRNILAAMMLSLLSIGAVQAAGSPIHEDYTALLALSEKMLEAAKASDATGFTAAATEASDVAKDQGNKGNSPRLQRISTKIKQAKKAVKSGDFILATSLTEEARVEMEKPDTKPTFGGTTEGGGRKGMFGEF
ncbi:hypothetical protein [Methyloglobulus sp.]|uniref:hypothetical protein n=1 Tax=Methyloglobulus sp. TaxID=2518622 RepID=UPI0032B85567